MLSIAYGIGDIFFWNAHVKMPKFLYPEKKGISFVPTAKHSFLVFCFFFLIEMIPG